MKKIYFLFFTIWFGITGFSQTNPAALTLPVTINFGTSAFTPPFTGMVAWTGSGTRPYGTQAAAEASLGGTDVLAAALFNTSPASGGGAGHYGHAVSGNARLTILQSGNSTNGTSQTALAINTTGLTNISVSYSLSLSVSNARDVGMVLQYRVGTAGSFTTVSGSAVTYNSSTTNGGDADGPTDNDPYNLTLPIAAEGNAVVQLRWITWRGAQAGNNSGMGLDDISVTGTSGGGPDVTPPTVSTLTPADNATNVSTNTNLQIVFSEPIIKGTGNIVIKKLSDNSTIQTIDVVNAAVSVAGSTATITINALLNATDYYIEIASGAFTDPSLNLFAGISGASTWNFTTIPVPAAGIIGNNYTFTNCASTFTNEGWSQYSVTGPSQFWACTTTGRTDANAVQMNAFVAANNNPLNEDWLISPAFNLTAASLPTLKFYSRGDFIGNSLQLKISINYVAGTDPNTAAWTNLTGNFAANVAGTGAWTLSDNIDLSTYNTTNVRLAWVYINPTTTASSRWTIDDVTLYTNVVLPPCAELTVQPSNLVLNATSGAVTGTFDLIPAPTSVQNYLIVRSLAAALTQLPVDGTLYTSGQTINGGNGTAVGVSVDGNFTDNSVSASTQYYYFVFAMEDQSCSSGPNYNQATPLTGSVTTPALAPCTTPTSPTTLVLTPANTTVSGSFTASSASKYLVVRSAVPPPLGALPTDGTVYTIGQTFGNGTVVTYATAANFTATGLTVSTQYYFYVFAANDACTGAPFYSASSLDGTTTTTNAPTGIPAGYYDPANGFTAQPLKTALKNIITNGSQVLSYTPGLWNLYQFSDLHRNDANTADIIWDMYSDNPTGPEPYTYTYGVNQCGSSSTEGGCYNREHSTPQSFFAQLSPMVSDAHHIFPTDAVVNNMRSNYPYGEVTNLATVPPAQNNPSLNGSKLGTGTNFGYNGTVFEPINSYKGDFARACLYMATRYEDEIISQNWSSLGTANALYLSTTDQPDAVKRRLQIYDTWQLKTLVKWHNQDPVSQKEIDRNNAVYYTSVNTIGAGTPKVQSNRNPFVDHPEYVAAIFNATGVLPVTVTNFTAQKVTDAVVLKWNVTAETDFKQYNIERSTDGNKFNVIGSLEGRNLPQYSFTDNNLPNATVVYYRLKMIDSDGKFNNSNILAVKLNKILSNALVYPNPTVGDLNIKLYEPLFTNSTLQILDVTGRMVKQQNVSANNVNIRLDVTGLSAGRYFIKIANSQQVINQSFVVIK